MNRHLLPALLILWTGCVHKSSVPGSEPVSYYEHKVTTGETLTSISRKLTGDSRNYSKILEVNPGLEPRKMPIGRLIKIPSFLVVKKTAKEPIKRQSNKPKVKPTQSSPKSEIGEGVPVSPVLEDNDEMTEQMPIIVPAAEAAPTQAASPKLTRDDDTKTNFPAPDLNETVPRPLETAEPVKMEEESEYEAFSVGKTPAPSPVTEIPLTPVETAAPTPNPAKKRSLLEEMLDSQ